MPISPSEAPERQCPWMATGATAVSSTVEKIRILTADGVLKTCSGQKPGSFRHAIGGYGMMEIIWKPDTSGSQ